MKKASKTSEIIPAKASRLRAKKAKPFFALHW
jgi:hypothetical protein